MASGQNIEWRCGKQGNAVDEGRRGGGELTAPERLRLGISRLVSDPALEEGGGYERRSVCFQGTFRTCREVMRAEAGSREVCFVAFLLPLPVSPYPTVWQAHPVPGPEDLAVNLTDCPPVLLSLHWGQDRETGN